MGGLVSGLHIAIMPVHSLVSLGMAEGETNSMKTTLFVLFGLCLACATAAFGQTAALRSNEPVMVEFASHRARATQKAMGAEQNLLEQSGFISARGERPLWEFATPLQVTPLGDSARMLKKAHETVKKTDIVWNN